MAADDDRNVYTYRPNNIKIPRRIMHTLPAQNVGLSQEIPNYLRSTDVDTNSSVVIYSSSILRLGT